MSGHDRTKPADFAIYRILASFVALSSVVLHCRQHNWCFWISRSHIQLPWGQGHARSRLPWVVSEAHFSRYNPNCTVVLRLGVIAESKTNVRFGISTYELTVYHPPCVKVIKVYPRSYEVADLG